MKRIMAVVLCLVAVMGMVQAAGASEEIWFEVRLPSGKVDGKVCLLMDSGFDGLRDYVEEYVDGAPAEFIFVIGGLAVKEGRTAADYAAALEKAGYVVDIVPVVQGPASGQAAPSWLDVI